MVKAIWDLFRKRRRTTDRYPDHRSRIMGGLWGSLVGDALGVPVEFQGRSERLKDPVVDMRGHGTHNQPQGTWSDDGAMMLCTVDSLLQAEFDTENLGDLFRAWLRDGLWTATGEAFDVGMTTAEALRRIAMGTPAEQAGGRNEHNNGNGSLMRILPVALRFSDKHPRELATYLSRASSLTHGHKRSQMACAFYGVMVRNLVLGQAPEQALETTRSEFEELYKEEQEIKRFQSVLEDDFEALQESEVCSSGYVIHTLHASIWSLLTTDDFRSCVLKAVNLGDDTDTTGCVTGGLAGVCYGLESIPEQWLGKMARRDDVDRLLRQFENIVPAPSTTQG